ncbi:membrane protein required for colicin V production [Cohaesibacter sp. ES.047]|uniref:CvpA family protein n=1 Tax=Cohaesibacter sp. ES.047 TaxID=1798205 RepID=UPI000BB9515A|nr:CvpA family protein [Cohaesibacter sp. ES.047]SNY93848.1 membrane protein required for colicin V production [Cohaesibacter sp. ES.047]
MPIELLDVILLVVLLISAFLAMIRGFVREVLAIGAWVAAAFATLKLFDVVLPMVTPYLTQPLVAQAATALGIFLITLIVVSFITIQISDFVLDSRIGALDRTLGFVFGALRGAILMAVALIFFNWFVPEDKQPNWVAQAKSKPFLNEMGDKLISLLPEDPQEQLMEKIRQQREGTPPNEEASYSNDERDAIGEIASTTAKQ